MRVLRKITWQGWQRFAGWVAVVAALSWILKFIGYSAVGEYPVPAGHAMEAFIAVMSFIGGIAILIVAPAVAAPLLKNRGRLMRIIGSLVVGFAVVILLGTMAEAVPNWGPVAALGSVESLNMVNLAGGLFYMAFGFWLLRPKTARGAAILGGIGGLSWVVNAALVTGGAAIEGWVVVLYQAGLFSLVTALVWAGIVLVRERRYTTLLGGLGLLLMVYAAPVITPLSDSAGVFLVGLAAGVLGFLHLRARHTAS